MTMYRYGRSSSAKLATGHTDLQKLFKEVIISSPWDIGILSVLRTKEEQNAIYHRGASQRDGIILKSKHQEGLAVDFGVYVKGKYINGDTPGEELVYYAVIGHILATAKRMNIPVRSGSDWDRDGDFSDNGFKDLGHIEYVL